MEEALREYDAARVLRCAKLQGDSAFVAERDRRRGGQDGRDAEGDDKEALSRPANMGMGDAEFVYNWQPERLRHFPWQPHE